MVCRHKCKRPRRSGVAAVELAILLPLLAFLFVVAIDFARIFYYCVTVTNCARNGAVYACDTTSAMNSPYKSVQEAALADAGNLSPAPTVTSTTVSDANGSYVEVTVTYQFTTITNYPGIPRTTNVTRTVRMRQVAAVPNF
jgi:Flp pilus assembly protein TadG